jgi:hypothetical protein
MDAPRGAFRHGVDRVGFLAAHADLDDAGIILHQLADGFAAQAPKTGKLADPVMLLESGVINFRKAPSHRVNAARTGKNPSGSVSTSLFVYSPPAV